MQTKPTIVILLFLLFGLSNISWAQNVNIPDGNFKALLVGNPLINTNGDGEIQEAEALAFSGTIDVHYQQIYDLTGIKAFRNLKALDCSECKLNNLDLSANSSLIILNCWGNPIKSLNVSKLVLLTELNCGYCQLMNLDITANISLVKLNCYANSLTSLDVSKNISLEELGCFANSLTSLDVSKNISLEKLECFANSLTSLDVSKNISLKYLYCGLNRLANLDVSANTAIEDLSCYSNQLVSLDLSANKALKALIFNNNYLTSIDVSRNVALCAVDCNNNLLTSLDMSANALLTGADFSNNLLTNLNVKNGNNHNFRIFHAENNRGLKCIKVDNALYSNSNWAYGIDPWANFSETCTVGIDEISPTEIHVFPNPSNGIFTISGVPLNTCIEIYTMNGKNVYSENSQQPVIDIDISNCPKGMYFVKVNNRKEILTTKIEIR